MKRSKWLAADMWRTTWRSLVLIGVAMALSASAQATSAVAPPDLLEAEKAFVVTARLVGSKAVEVQYSIAPGYYMYRDRFRFTVNEQPVLLTGKAWPTGKLKQDATFGKVITYRNSVRLLLPVSPAMLPSNVASREPLILKVTSQGCADAGVCYPPLHQTLILQPESSAWIEPQEASVGGFSRDRPSTNALTDKLTHGK